MNRKFGSTLFISILASVSFIVILAILYSEKAPWLPVVGGLIPLIFYHLFFLAPRAKKEISQTEIDSVYYYGFLITISALGVSAVSIAMQGIDETRTKEVAFQFGLGLLATGYAIIARLHLMTIASTTNEDSHEEVLNQYIQKTRDLVTNVDMFSSEMAVYSNKMIEKSSQNYLEMQKQVTQIMLDSAHNFSEKINGIIDAARDGVIELRNVVNDSTFATERQELAKNVRSTINTITKLNLAIEKLSVSTELESNKFIESAQNISILNNLLLDTNDELRKLPVTIKDIVNFSVVISKASEGMSEIAAKTNVSTAHMSEMKSIIENTQSEYKKYCQIIEKITDSTSHMNESLFKLSSFGSDINQINEGITKLKESSIGFGHELKSLNEILIDSTGNLKDSMNEANDVINNNLETSSLAVTKLTNKLVDLAQHIIDKTNRH